MKLAIFGVLALCLVLTNAGTVDHIENTVKELESYAASLVHLADEVAKDVENKLEEVAAQPMKIIDGLLMVIEKIKDHNKACVVDAYYGVENTVWTMEDSLITCGKTATVDSATVVFEIGKTTTSIVFDIIDLLKNYRRCKQYTNAALSKTCLARVTLKATLLVVKTKNAVSFVRQSVNETIPQIKVDLEDCYSGTKATARSELITIHDTVKDCYIY